MPKVSVIVPIYGVEKYLRQCVDSILNQTLEDIEVILVDDGSKDHCPQIVDEYATKDSRIVAIHQPNGGISVTRNTGLNHASAPYIMFCDGDDFYDANMCELMLRAIESSSADIVACGTKIFYETDESYRATDERYYSVKFEGLKDSKELSERACDVSLWNKIFRRSIITEHGLRCPEGLKFEDFYFFHAYMVYAKKIFFIKERPHNYRRRIGSIMNRTFNSRRTSSIDHLKCSVLLWNLFKNEGILEERKEYIYDVFFEGFYFALHHAGCDEEKQEVLKFAYAFAREELILDPLLASERKRKIQLLKKGVNPDTGVKKEYRLAKLIKKRIDESRFKEESRLKYSLLGIPLIKKTWKVSSLKRTLRTSILGIQVYKQTSSLEKQLPNIRTLKCNNSVLLDELRQLESFTFFPILGDLGSMFEVGATLSFFEKNQLPYTLYKDSDQPKTLVVGGHEWSEAHKEQWQKMLTFLPQTERVLILPSSFCNCSSLIEMMDERFVVFCREQQSYDYLQEKHTKAGLFLDDDMAWRMDLRSYTDELLHTYQGEYFQRKLSHIAWSFPRLGNLGCFLSNDQYPQNDIDLASLPCDGESPSREMILFNTLLFLCLIDQVQEVQTDRWEVAIASILLNKKVLVVESTRRSCSQVLKHIPCSYRNVTLSDQLSQNSLKEHQLSPKKSYKIESVLLTA